MSREWNDVAGAWIAAMGETGDWSRRHVLDPAMLERVDTGGFECALDVGCGEGRFCRALATRGIAAIGIDPAARMIEAARERDPGGSYLVAGAEALPFPDASFDLVVSYLTLIDIPDFRRALAEMARVARPGGVLLIANLNGFITSVPNGWVAGTDGKPSHYAVDRYMDEFPATVEFSKMRVENWHRPHSAYMRTLLGLGLQLVHFDEPLPRSGTEADQQKYRRAPWFHVMEWRRPSSDHADN